MPSPSFPSRRRYAAAVSLLAALAMVAALFTPTPAAAAAPARTSATPRSAAPGDVLPERMRSEAAIAALAARLPAVAADNDMTPREFVALLRADDQVWVGRSGRLLYVDEGLADHDAEHADDHDVAGSAHDAAASALDPVLGAYGPEDAFALQSRPGAQRVVYLDFDGHTTPGGGWSGTPAASYDTDGDPSSFSTVERNAIIAVWAHVAEDFAPFDVNVTTTDPGADAIRRTTSSDTTFGTRAVITPTRTDCASCGGIAYVGTFDIHGGSASTGWTHDRYQPAWVYMAGTNPKTIAEAASHEAGHNLGLGHDGTSTTAYYSGQGNWAPIMGTGYYRSVTQWSQGEYADANNTEDDLSVIAANGAPHAADDHGDTPATATTIGTVTTLDSVTVDEHGTIANRNDIDAFTFATAGGPVVVSAAPAATGANLDIELALLDQNGTRVAVADPPGLGAALTATVPAGTYTITVDGTGAGDPAATGYSDYGSMGRYRVTGTLPAPAAPNTAPTSDPTADVTSGPAPLTVNFGSGTSHDPDGTIVRYAWSFGDGKNLSGPTPTYTYTTPGTYLVRLTTTDDDGEKKTSGPITITVTSAPVADATADVTSGPAPLTVNFGSGTSHDPDGTIVRYAWSFGDGKNLSGPTPTYTYTTPGTYLVRLTVTDDTGAKTTSAPITITVAGAVNEAPVADATADVTSGPAPLTVNFGSGTSHDPDGTIVRYAWSFGDGKNLSGPTPSRTYDKPGTYLVRLTVTDDTGAKTTSAPITITVTAAG